jgi:hypothetical protein
MKVDGNYEFGTIDQIKCERCLRPLMWTAGQLGSTTACCGIRYTAYVPEDDPAYIKVFSQRDQAR